MKPTKLSTLFCLSLVLGLGGISSPSEAKVAKTQKQAKHNKVKQVKQQRRAHRKAAPQRRLAALRLPSKAAAKNKRVTKAIREGKLLQLTTVKNGARILNFGRFSKASRLEIRNALDSYQGEMVLEFGNIPASERVAIAVASFRGHDANPLTQQAWKLAGTASSIAVQLNMISFGTGKNKVSYTNTMGGTFRTRTLNGKKINEAARMGQGKQWKIQTF